MLEQVSSWREESSSKLSNIIDVHINSVNAGINDLAEEVWDLRIKLSALSKDKSDLLQDVNKLSSENSQLKAAIVQPEPDMEGSQRVTDEDADPTEDPNSENEDNPEHGEEKLPVSNENDDDHELNSKYADSTKPTTEQVNADFFNDIMNDSNYIKLVDMDDIKSDQKVLDEGKIDTYDERHLDIKVGKEQLRDNEV